MRQLPVCIHNRGNDAEQRKNFTLPVIVSAGLVSALALTSAHAQQASQQSGGVLPTVEVTTPKAKAKAARQKQGPAAPTAAAEPVVEAVEPDLVVWTSIWPWRRDARIRFELSGSRRSGTTLCWMLTVDDPVPDNEVIIRMRKRVNVLINAHLRSTFGQ